MVLEKRRKMGGMGDLGWRILASLRMCIGDIRKFVRRC